MVIAQENKCAMCGKDAIGRGKHDNDDKENGNKQGQQQENNSSLSTVSSGLHYNFDTASCALMFKKLIDIYGSNFACSD
jgi:hypothetical protein